MSISSQPTRELPATPGTRAVRMGGSDVIMDRRADGTIHISSTQALGPYPEKMTERLEYWASTAPERTFIAQRDAAGAWRTLSYAQTLVEVRRIGAALLTRNLSPERPVAILSGNDIEHALLGLAAMYIGIPYAPISPAYSLVSDDFGKLRHVLRLLTPGVIFAADGDVYRRAIEAAIAPDVEVVVTSNPIPGRAGTLFAGVGVDPTAAVDVAHAGVGPDTIAKILFTSGSTGQPKGVINTQRMWCSNQMMLRHVLAFLEDEPPVLLDWAPWHHTAGGNLGFGLVLFNGGTFYIDEGKPLPGAIDATVRNLRDVATTVHFNLPKGFGALLPYLREDAALRNTFFGQMKMLWYGGAALAQHVFDGIQDLAVQTIGVRVPFLAGLGSTETSPFAFCRTWPSNDATNVGLPAIDTTLKLVPIEDRYEVRLKGSHITPGYWGEPGLTEQAFDEEGFYRLGDTVRFADPLDASQGFLFAGRIAEDFKLSSGTWVNVGPLRAAFISHFAPYARDVVIAGEDRDVLAALILPDVDECRRLAPDLTNATQAELFGDFRVRLAFQQRLNSFARQATGSSNRVVRATLEVEPPSLDLGEATDKGSLNQRAVLRHRATTVERLYAVAPSPGILVAKMAE